MIFLRVTSSQQVNAVQLVPLFLAFRVFSNIHRLYTQILDKQAINTNKLHPVTLPKQLGKWPSPELMLLEKGIKLLNIQTVTSSVSMMPIYCIIVRMQ